MEFGLLGGPTWWFLAGLLGFLVLATVVAEMMYRRTASEGLRATLLNVRQRIFAWWIMVAVLVGSLALGETAVVLLFLALSLLALREFANLLPPGERDRRVLSWIMVVLAPLHFWFVWEHWYCLLYTSPSPRDQRGSRMPSSA